jgi:hypothetical protein
LQTKPSQLGGLAKRAAAQVDSKPSIWKSKLASIRNGAPEAVSVRSAIAEIATVKLAELFNMKEAAGKESKEHAHYKDNSNVAGQNCARCIHFNRGRCDKVVGLVKPSGVCKYFNARGRGKQIDTTTMGKPKGPKE